MIPRGRVKTKHDTYHKPHQRKREKKQNTNAIFLNELITMLDRTHQKQQDRAIHGEKPAASSHKRHTKEQTTSEPPPDGE